MRYSSSGGAIMKGSPLTAAGMHNHCDPFPSGGGGGKFAPLHYLAKLVVGETHRFADIAVDLPPSGEGCTWFGLKRMHLLSFFVFEVLCCVSIYHVMNKRRLKQIARQEERASAAPPRSDSEGSGYDSGSGYSRTDSNSTDDRYKGLPRVTPAALLRTPH